ncbi:uncharacterized protein LOC113374171 [Ctenocephalides felis]|uniref:uncharacterized protein LOC113374171 n=1 Tax=Ctenocephalides felis TaxID=7515 RepID=UPI000E6E4A0B|nr:uncharacterized protein LOC113374171 [Ctenocephalides felis]
MTLGMNTGRNTYKWVGEALSLPQFKDIFPDQLFYKGVQVNDLVIRIGSYVLLKTKKDKELSQNTTIVARVELIMGTAGTILSKSTCQLMVRKFIFPKDVPPNCFYNNIIFNFDLEVIEDLRPSDPIFKLGQVIDVCKVAIGAETDEAEKTIHDLTVKHNLVNSVVYLCRYRLIQNENAQVLEPVIMLPPAELLDE